MSSSTGFMIIIIIVFATAVLASAGVCNENKCDRFGGKCVNVKLFGGIRIPVCSCQKIDRIIDSFSRTEKELDVKICYKHTSENIIITYTKYTDVMRDRCRLQREISPTAQQCDGFKKTHKSRRQHKTMSKCWKMNEYSKIHGYYLIDDYGECHARCIPGYGAGCRSKMINFH